MADSTGKRIMKRRLQLEMSQDELARKVGYKDRSSIARLESGEREPRQSVLVKIALALCCTPAYLIGWTDDPSPEIIDDAPLDVIKYFDGDEDKIAAFMRAVDEDRAAESAEQAQQALLLSLFNKLNCLGKQRVLELAEDLVQMEKYTE